MSQMGDNDEQNGKSRKWGKKTRRCPPSFAQASASSTSSASDVVLEERQAHRRLLSSLPFSRFASVPSPLTATSPASLSAVMSDPVIPSKRSSPSSVVGAATPAPNKIPRLDDATPSNAPATTPGGLSGTVRRPKTAALFDKTREHEPAEVRGVELETVEQQFEVEDAAGCTSPYSLTALPFVADLLLDRCRNAPHHSDPFQPTSLPHPVRLSVFSFPPSLLTVVLSQHPNPPPPHPHALPPPFYPSQEVLKSRFQACEQLFHNPNRRNRSSLSLRPPASLRRALGPLT
jgi:hypothetical protein